MKNKKMLTLAAASLFLSLTACDRGLQSVKSEPLTDINTKSVELSVGFADAAIAVKNVKLTLNDTILSQVESACFGIVDEAHEVKKANTLASRRASLADAKIPTDIMDLETMANMNGLLLSKKTPFILSKSTDELKEFTKTLSLDQVLVAGSVIDVEKNLVSELYYKDLNSDNLLSEMNVRDGQKIKIACRLVTPDQKDQYLNERFDFVTFETKFEEVNGVNAKHEKVVAFEKNDTISIAKVVNNCMDLVGEDNLSSMVLISSTDTAPSIAFEDIEDHLRQSFPISGNGDTRINCVAHKKLIMDSLPRNENPEGGQSRF